MQDEYQTYKVKVDQLHNQKTKEQPLEHIDHAIVQPCYVSYRDGFVLNRDLESEQAKTLR